MDRIHNRVSILLLGALALFVGCQVASDGSELPNPTSKAPNDVRLGYFANITHAQAVLGVASGDYERAVGPAKLTTRVFNAGPSMIEALFAGEIDIGYIGPGPALSGFEKSHGEGLVVISGAAANGVVIVARPNSGIASMKDLAGKRLATPQHGNTQDISARHYLTAELGQSTADTIVPISNAEQLGLMARGEIDAAWAPEPWGARLEVEAGARLIAEEKDLWPNGEFMLTLVIVRPEFLRDHPDIVTSFLQAHVQLTHRLASSPQQAQAELLDAMFDLTGQRLNPLVIEKAIRRVKFTDKISLDTFQQYSEWAFALGFSRAKPDLDRLIDTTWLSRAQAETSANTAGSQRP